MQRRSAAIDFTDTRREPSQLVLPRRSSTIRQRQVQSATRRATAAAVGIALYALGAPISSSASSLERDGWCGTPRTVTAPPPSETAPTIQAFLAYPKGSAVDVPVLTARLQRLFADADDRVLAATRGRKGLRVRTGISGCSTGYIDVALIPVSASATTFGRVLAEMDDLTNSTPMTLWAGIIANAPTSLPICGLGGRETDLEVRTPLSPAHDFSLDGGAYGAVAERCSSYESADTILLHEIFHGLGADHFPEPNDLMGPHEDPVVIDVGADDYFAPEGQIVGPDGTPLWNIAESLYLCHTPDCGKALARPPVSVTARALDAERVEYSAAGASYYRWTGWGGLQRDVTGPRFVASRYATVTVQGVASNGALGVVQTLTVPPAPSTSPIWHPATTDPVGTGAPAADVGQSLSSTQVSSAGPPVTEPTPRLTVARQTRRSLVRAGVLVSVRGRVRALCVVSVRAQGRSAGSRAIRLGRRGRSVTRIPLNRAGRRALVRRAALRIRATCNGRSTASVLVRVRGS